MKIFTRSRLVDRLLLSSMKKQPLPKAPTDFTIDAAHELALFIYNVDERLRLKPVPYMCSRSGGPECAIYARDENIFCVSSESSRYPSVGHKLDST
jgi:hypothetical protein